MSAPTPDTEGELGGEAPSAAKSANDELERLEELRRLVEEFKRDYEDLDEEEVLERLNQIGELVLEVAEEDDRAWDLWFDVEKSFAYRVWVSDGCDDYGVILVDEIRDVAYLVVIGPDGMEVHTIHDSDISTEAAQELAHFVFHQPWKVEGGGEEG